MVSRLGPLQIVRGGRPYGRRPDVDNGALTPDLGSGRQGRQTDLIRAVV